MGFYPGGLLTGILRYLYCHLIIRKSKTNGGNLENVSSQQNRKKTEYLRSKIFKKASIKTVNFKQNLEARVFKF